MIKVKANKKVKYENFLGDGNGYSIKWVPVEKLWWAVSVSFRQVGFSGWDKREKKRRFNTARGAVCWIAE